MKLQFLFLTLALICFGCQTDSNHTHPTPNRYDVIPLPASLKPADGSFPVNAQTKLVIDNKNTEVLKVADYFLQKVKDATALTLSYGETASAKNNIQFELDETIKEEEGYELSINKKQVVLRAKSPQGLFYSAQSLLQLLQTNTSHDDAKNWKLPAVEIKDNPRFVYRGMHLDVSRHFFGVDVVKRYIDLLAYHKMNYFHWHLTDDQGWRIEIKKYPKLTEIGGFRSGTLVGHYNDQPHQFDKKRQLGV